MAYTKSEPTYSRLTFLSTFLRQGQQARYFTEDLGKGVLLEMVEISTGEFMMGSPANVPGYEMETPQRRVKVPGFFMGRFEITVAQWKSVTGRAPFYPEHDNLPVMGELLTSAQRFCQDLSQRTGRTYRLPSEAEWEYACRAGTTTDFHFGAIATSQLARFSAGGTLVISHETGLSPTLDPSKMGGPIPVGCYPPNAFGLHDMHGNADEWCADEWRDNYQDASTDAKVWDTGKDPVTEALYRITRGGSWGDDPGDGRSAARKMVQQAVGNVGLRVVCDAASCVDS